MALRFPRFSQGLAQDPTTRRIWFGILTTHYFKSNDDIIEECIYQNFFASHFGQLAIIFLWTSENLFHVAWQGNFESSSHEELPKHLTLHPFQFKGLVNQIINSNWVGLKINDLLVVEYYSHQTST